MGCRAFTCTGTDCPLVYDTGALPGKYQAWARYASSASAHMPSTRIDTKRKRRVG